jgi:hypothetical protein
MSTNECKYYDSNRKATVLIVRQSLSFNDLVFPEHPLNFIDIRGFSQSQHQQDAGFLRI